MAQELGMAWNHYQNMRRKVGVALRVSDLPDEIVNCAPQDERVWQVRVAGRHQGKAVLRVWSTKFRPGELERHTVTILTVDEDPMWTVECP